MVITAGAAQKPGETRLQLLKKNADIVGGIAETISRQGCQGVMLIVSNPVDVLTYVARSAAAGRVAGLLVQGLFSTVPGSAIYLASIAMLMFITFMPISLENMETVSLLVDDTYCRHPGWRILQGMRQMSGLAEGEGND